MYVYCPHTECVIVQCCNGFEDWTDKIHTENTKSPRAMEFNPQMHGGGVKCKNVASCTANTERGSARVQWWSAGLEGQKSVIEGRRDGRGG